MTVGLSIYLVIIYVLAGSSASIFYHRILTHKVITLQPWFEKLMVVIALPAGTPVQWVGTHRQHHLFTDVEGDPHSPTLYGFCYAHCGWYIATKNPIICLTYALAGPFRILFDGYWRPRHRLEYNYLAQDISDVPFYQWISKPSNYMFMMWLYLTVLLTVALLLAGINGLIGVWIILVMVYNLGDSVNSLGHLYGQRTNLKNKSGNNPLLALFTFGEGFHANHHQSPEQVFPNQPTNLCITRVILFIWKNLGLIKDSRYL
jgi:fatty-acid desaturase